MSATHEIFLSYARTDRERVRPLVEAIEKRGWKVWWDHDLAPGEHFRDVIEPALKAAKVVVVAWSKDSITRDWVLDEAEDGRQRRILVPVLLDAVLPPLGFRQMHATDLAAWRGRGDDPQLKKVIERIEALLPARPAPEPEKKSSGSVTAGMSEAHARGRARYRFSLGVVAAGLALALVSLVATMIVSKSSAERATVIGYCVVLLALVGAPLAFAMTERFSAWILVSVCTSVVAVLAFFFVVIALFDAPRKDETHSWLLFMLGAGLISLGAVLLWTAPVRDYVNAKNPLVPRKRVSAP